MKDALALLRSNTSFRQWGELDALMETSGNEVKNSVLNIYYKQMKKLGNRRVYSRNSPSMKIWRKL